MLKVDNWASGIFGVTYIECIESVIQANPYKWVITQKGISNVQRDGRKYLQSQRKHRVVGMPLRLDFLVFVSKPTTITRISVARMKVIKLLRPNYVGETQL